MPSEEITALHGRSKLALTIGATDEAYSLYGMIATDEGYSLHGMNATDEAYSLLGISLTELRDLILFISSDIRG